MLHELLHHAPALFHGQPIRWLRYAPQFHCGPVEPWRYLRMLSHWRVL